MAYTEIHCPGCGSKQMLMIGPNAHEVQCSACAKMIPVQKLVEVQKTEDKRAEDNAKQAERMKEEQDAKEQAKAKEMMAKQNKKRRE